MFEKKNETSDSFMFDKVTVTNALIKKLQVKSNTEYGIPYSQLLKRLELIK